LVQLARVIEEPSKAGTAPKSSKGAFAWLANLTAAALCAAGCLGLGIFAKPLLNPLQTYSPQGMQPHLAPLGQQYYGNAWRRKVERAVAVYFVETLEYPNDLGQLLTRDLLEEDELNRIEQTNLLYIKSLEGYRLFN
jgi:hypothetical protein